jgi:uncharacterized membrane protein YbhN (UPF0104 family)
VGDTSDTDHGDAQIIGVNRRKALLTVGVALLLTIGVISLIGHAANYHELLKAVRQADHRWLPLCLVGELIAYAGYILAYRDLARADGGPCLRFWDVTRVVVAGFGAFVVGSSFGGLAVDYWALSQAGVDRHEAGRRVLALNTLEWLVLALAAALAAAAVLGGRGKGAPLAMTLGWLIVVPACIAAAVWVSSPRRASRLGALGEPCERPHGLSPRRWLAFGRCALRRGFGDAVGCIVLLRYVFRRGWRFAPGIAGFVLYWAGDILTLYAALRALGPAPELSPLVLAYTTGYVATALPLPAGGAGGIEASLALCLHAVGVPLSQAVLGVLVYRLFTFWLPILPALAFLPTVKNLADDLPARARHGRRRPSFVFDTPR